MITKFKKWDVVELLPFNEGWWNEEPYWSEDMDWFKGKQHVVVEIDCDGDVVLKKGSSDTCYFKPEWLKLSNKVDLNVISKFWVVLHEDDISEEFTSLKKAEAYAKELTNDSESSAYVLQVVGGYRSESKAVKLKVE